MKFKITIYMKSGNSFSFKCTNFTMNRLPCENREFKWEGANRTISFEPSEVEAIVMKRVLF